MALKMGVASLLYPPSLQSRLLLSKSHRKPPSSPSSHLPLIGNHQIPSIHSFLRCSKMRPVIRLNPCFASDQQNGQAGDEVIDRNVLQYCSIDGKKKKTLGEMEQDFIQALQSFYYDGAATMSNEEFDNLKEELMWEGSSVVMLSKEEQRFLEASMAYVSGKPILTDEEFDNLKLTLKREGSSIVSEGPRCSLRSRKVYSDLDVDYFKMFLLNVPAAVVALLLFFFLDDLTGFEITYLLELPEPFSFIFTWFAALPLIFWSATAITRVIVKDFLILKGVCPNCGTENVSFFGTILSIPSGGKVNTLKCSNCGSSLVFNAGTRLITLPELSKA
ncbi:ferredoxin-plastoquinone reductase, PGR5-like protein 1, chloroplastic [Zostera marina]|uniref:Ferredoxin-plastoquinone reductase, PGR5-like protein 1, chloroplastic n=1 Tax=Zostera marina TaxID=29655 RepID=A0A0K9PGV1_ZOSMR|nr:ferredoxin-plastoquinone reductase, PGR5-like protein 1, chloroplastic [Zostera marina]